MIIGKRDRAHVAALTRTADHLLSRVAQLEQKVATHVAKTRDAERRISGQRDHIKTVERKLAELNASLEDAKIRQHFTATFKAKRAYHSAGDARHAAIAVATPAEPMAAYRCEICNHWHIGHEPALRPVPVSVRIDP